MVLDIDAPEAWRAGAHGFSSSPVILTFPPMTPLRLSCNFSLLRSKAVAGLGEYLWIPKLRRMASHHHGLCELDQDAQQQGEDLPPKPPRRPLSASAHYYRTVGPVKPHILIFKRSQ